MSDKELRIFSERLKCSLDHSEMLMLEDKARKRQEVVVCDDNDYVYRVNAAKIASHVISMIKSNFGKL